jgi:hypothetical protein
MQVISSFVVGEWVATAEALSAHGPMCRFERCETEVRSKKRNGADVAHPTTPATTKRHGNPHYSGVGRAGGGSAALH